MGAFIAVVTGRRSKWAVLFLGIVLAGVAGLTIAVSALTVILALLCLLAAQLNDVAALGPACAGGIVCALIVQLVVLPALLLAAGRRVFWPFIPRAGDEVPEASGGFSRLGQRLARRPRPVWVGVSVLLTVCCIGLLAYRGGVSQQNGFRGSVGSVAAQQIRDASFPAGSSDPAIVLVRPPSATGQALGAASGTPGVRSVSVSVSVSVSAPARLGDAQTFTVTLAAGPATPAAQRAVGPS
ncbi:MAG: MMPL family transporter, partial [Trebonia sp.]